jgi:hypothetical protein
LEANLTPYRRRHITWLQVVVSIKRGVVYGQRLGVSAVGSRLRRDDIQLARKRVSGLTQHPG